MTELQRHRLKEIASTYAISFAISVGSLPMIPFRVNPVIPVLIFGTSFGTFFCLAGILGPKVRHRSFPLTLLLQTLFYFAVIGGAFFFALWPFISVNSGFSLFHPKMLSIIGSVFTSPVALGTLGGVFVLMLLISSAFQIGKKLGPGVLWNWITGRYHDPREEQRIFMFLDLKDSTRLAEQLGNLRFSELVRDFFSDLTKPVIETRGEVSHYIGDEAVLTWRPDRGLPKANCIELFFKMRSAIDKRQAHYLKKYGFVPEFKAGVHVGPVVACEVGDIKSEVVFHGDVLNTAARIQGHCNELGADLLVSEDLLDMLALPDRLSAQPHGRFLFKGKEHEVGVYSIAEELGDELPVAAKELDKATLV